MARVGWLKGKACARELQEEKAGKESVCIMGQDTCQLRGQVKVAISEDHHVNHREDCKGWTGKPRGKKTMEAPVFTIQNSW